MKEEIEKFIKKVFINLNYDLKYLKVNSSDKKELADYQINSVFALSKELKESPVEIGNKITEEINKLSDFEEYFKEVTFCFPGFINIRVSNKLINKYLNFNIINNLGIKETDKKELYFLDYGGANIAKPLHIGHMRPAIIGESLKRMLGVKGHKTIGDSHFGDFGLQIGLVIYAILQDKENNITLEYLEKTYPKMSALSKEDEEVLFKSKEIVRKLQEGNEEYIKLWKQICEVSVLEIKRIYKFLGVDFDLWLSESDSNEYIPELFEYLNQKNLIETDDGAKIIRIETDNDNKNMPPIILENSKGAYMYATTDMASIYERVKKYSPDHILYIVDARQQLHFEQLFRASDKAEIISKDKLEHIYFGTINGTDGKPFKTRSGDTLKLIDLFEMVKESFISKKEENKLMQESDLNKIINAIIKFADLQNNVEKNYVFDISKFSDVNGKTGPYMLYTVLRIKKILSSNNYEITDFNEMIYNNNDRELRLKLLELDEFINKSIENRNPHFIAEYAYDLAVLSNTFYQNNNISNLKDEINKKEWLKLLDFTYKIIEKCLELLIIEVPSKM